MQKGKTKAGANINVYSRFWQISQYSVGRNFVATFQQVTGKLAVF